MSSHPVRVRPLRVGMPARVAAPNGARLRRILRWGALVVFVLLTGSVALMAVGAVRTRHGLVLVILVSVAAVMAVTLWIIGVRRYRVAGYVLFISAGRLVLTSSGRPIRSVELAGSRATVELVGGVRERSDVTDEPLLPRKPVDSDLSIGVGEYFVPLHPVLRVEDVHSGDVIVVELCDVAGRRMRDREQLAMLRDVVETDIGAGHAAGQLRTLMRWQRLPRIVDADPDAVPSTPADRPDHAQVLPTVVRAGVPAAEIQIGPGPRPRE